MIFFISDNYQTLQQLQAIYTENVMQRNKLKEFRKKIKLRFLKHHKQ